MKTEIILDEQELNQLVMDEIIRRVVNSDREWRSDISVGIRKGIDGAVRDYIYSNKEMIIDRVVERAAREMVRKGFNKFFEKQEVTHD